MADKKISKKFKKWWKEHRTHLILHERLGGTTWCDKCKIVAPYPYKKES